MRSTNRALYCWTAPVNAVDESHRWRITGGAIKKKKPYEQTEVPQKSVRFQQRPTNRAPNCWTVLVVKRPLALRRFPSGGF